MAEVRSSRSNIGDRRFLADIRRSTSPSRVEETLDPVQRVLQQAIRSERKCHPCPRTKVLPMSPTAQLAAHGDLEFSLRLRCRRPTESCGTTKTGLNDQAVKRGDEKNIETT
jgi:hypothetical protein